MKTPQTYKDEILELYRKDKGGVMSCYLFSPTRQQIREACICMYTKRSSTYDQYILDRFFQFKDSTLELDHIQQFKADKFLPIVKFLKGQTHDTASKNLELISWLIDFNPRPLSNYLMVDKFDFSQKKMDNFKKSKPGRRHHQGLSIKEASSPKEAHPSAINLERIDVKRLLTLLIIMLFGALLLVTIIAKNLRNMPSNQSISLLIPFTKLY